MICKKCKKPISDDSSYCIYCGDRVIKNYDILSN